MSARAPATYIVRSGDTLRGLARRFRLHSWQAISRAPGNAGISHREPDAALEVGTVVLIPPSVRELMAERLRHLNRVRPLLLRHFHELEELFDRTTAAVQVVGELGDERTVAGLLGALETQVRKDVALLHVAAQPLAAVNDALAATHVHDRDGLDRYAGGNADYAGLNWLVTPELLELWYTMWATGMWASRWRGQTRDQALRSARLYLNVVRSRVAQQADQRVRETLAAIDALSTPGDEG